MYVFAQTKISCVNQHRDIDMVPFCLTYGITEKLSDMKTTSLSLILFQNVMKAL